MSHHPNKTLRMIWRPRGFTLIELMVTLVLSAGLVAGLYQFFAQTSESMYEADSLAGTTDQTRFALEMIARNLQSAGSFATTDSTTDLWYNTTQARVLNIRPRAIIQPLAQQDQVIGLQNWAENKDPQNAPGTQVLSSDSLIVMGAFDFPLSFQIDDVRNAGQTNMQVRVPINSRGVFRLLSPDPFSTKTIDKTSFAFPAGFENIITGYSGAANIWQGRMLRVVDRQGYIQLATMSAAPVLDNNTGIQLTLGGTPGAYLMARQANELMGLAPSTDDGTEDIGYDASFVDVFRYRVCQDPADPANLRLVRERVNAALAIQPNPNISMPATCGTNPDIIEQIPLIDRVVDFQVWFDCNDAPQIGEKASASWGGFAGTWIRNDTSVAGNNKHNCTLDGAGGSMAGQVARARIAHLRVSVRTENERRDIGNYMFLRDGAGQALGTVQTVDINQDDQNSARVVTFQLDVELPNTNFRTHRTPTGP